jgi:hypothetical protein
VWNPQSLVTPPLVGIDQEAPLFELLTRAPPG